MLVGWLRRNKGVVVVVVVVQIHSFALIGWLFETIGVPWLDPHHRYRGQNGRPDGDILPLDLAQMLPASVRRHYAPIPWAPSERA